MFQAIKNQVDFPKLEEEVLSFWEKERIFERSIANREKSKPFVFYDGPPFATGLPHYGHLLASTVKDIVPRYYSMRGFKVERRFGWDCHGLPVEMEIQNKLGLKNNQDIVDYGVDKFNEACKEIVFRYRAQWQSTISRLGRWVDFDNDYKTMDKDFMESVWWVFKKLYDKGLIYKGFKVMPYSWKTGTVLSNFEANLNYRDVDDPSIVVKFESVAKEKHFFLAWTTTPWTLVANLALAVNPDLTYLEIKNKSNLETYYLGEHSFKKFKNKEDYQIISQLKGSSLVGREYKPLFNYASAELELANHPNCFKINAASFVAEDEGVGIVHITSGYGESDNELAKEVNLPHFDPINSAGEFDSKIDFVAGENIKEADKKIIQELKSRKRIFLHETIRHNYPYCWRTDTPLMYKAISTWFVKVESFRDNLVANNQKIKWLPTHIKDGRFGKWLENVKDWAISRNRFWGTPLPIWENGKGDYLCYGDIASLVKDSEQAITDLHKHHIDKVTVVKNGETFTRVNEVLDCWFESGSMPYAHQHFPFENQSTLEDKFPADFISEGIDQTRGWFYTLLVISSGLFGKPSFKNVVVSGLILAEDGKKMSKRLKNYPSPNSILDRYGADALRVYLISSSVIKAETLRFSEKGLKEIVKNIMIPLWNSLSFLVTYARMDEWSYKDFAIADLNNPLDRWLFSSKETLVSKVNHAMENYQLYHAVPPLIEFIDKLTNIYIRRSRKRYWKSEKDGDKDQAYFTLYTVLKDFSIILAPFMPFVSERMYQILNIGDNSPSVHLADYPIHSEENVDGELEKELSLVEKIISLGRALRLKYGFKVRQPLPSLTVLTKDEKLIHVAKKYDTMIKEELNVKELVTSSREEDYVEYSAKINFQLWGKKLGREVQSINQKVMHLTSLEINALLKKKQFKLKMNEKEIDLELGALDIRRSGKKGSLVLNDGEITCVLNTELSEALIMEGLAREVVNRIQKHRKELDLEYNQKIIVKYNGSGKINAAIAKNKDYISYETLAEKLFLEENVSSKKENINQEKFAFELVKIA